MTTEIKGIWKHGKAVPLTDIEVEENTNVVINIPSRTSKHLFSFQSLAGVWKKDDETYSCFKKVYNERSKFKLRL